MKSKRVPLVVLVSLGFLLVAHVGLVSEADAALYAVFFAVLRPKWCPYLLVLMASVQDAPGFSRFWSYVGFVSVAFVFMTLALSRKRRATPDLGFAREFHLLLFLAVGVVAYGFMTSTVYDLTRTFEQSPDRPYATVAALMVLNVLVAYFAVRTLLREPSGERHLRMVGWIAIAHALSVGLFQVFWGPEFFRSSSGVDTLLESVELVEAGTLGIPRINGPSLSPNTFALTIALLFMLLLGASSDQRVKMRFALVYVLIGTVVGVLTLSRAVLVFSLAGSLALLWNAARVKALFVGGAGFVASVLGVAAIDWDLALQSLRFSGAELGNRGEAWDVVVRHFGAQEWLFGTGLSHWRPFFLEHLGFSLSDPHSLPLSIPGTFGLVGVTFYVFLGVFLLKKLGRHGLGLPHGILALMMLLLTFGVDLVSIPYVFGNTTVTFLLWVSLALLFSSRDERKPA